MYSGPVTKFKGYTYWRWRSKRGEVFEKKQIFLFSFMIKITIKVIFQ
jgi:hypothetical protein